MDSQLMMFRNECNRSAIKQFLRHSVDVIGCTVLYY